LTAENRTIQCITDFIFDKEYIARFGVVGGFGSGGCGGGSVGGSGGGVEWCHQWLSNSIMMSCHPLSPSYPNQFFLERQGESMQHELPAYKARTEKIPVEVLSYLYTIQKYTSSSS
jgi:hypothetical protein